MNYPVEPVVRPSSLLCQSNGSLDATALRTIGFGSRLERTAARSWDALWIAGQKAGWDLTWTYGGAYRTLEQQRALFFQRWSPEPITGRPTAFYAGGTWWLRQNVARAAVPGTSNHGWGLAIDIALGSEPAVAEPITPALTWLVDVADLYGFSWEAQNEPWHIRYVRGDEVPVGTLQIEAWSETQQ